MKQLTFILNTRWISALLLNMLSMQCMEKMWCHVHPEEYATLQRQYRNEIIKKSIMAEAYNQNCPLIKLSDENLFNHFLSCCYAHDTHAVKRLSESIKTFLSLSATCKNLNALLPFKTIGRLCERYPMQAKNQALSDLMQKMQLYHCGTGRLTALILLHAGTDANALASPHSSLLKLAALKNDTQMITTLFKRQANPNDTSIGCPTFFYATTKKMLQIFINRGVNLHMIKKHDNTNALWQTIQDSYPYSLTKFYLESGLDAANLRSRDNACLLHTLAEASHENTTGIVNLLHKAKLLLDVIPHMINALNAYDQTPRDIAQLHTATACKSFIALLRKHGGKTTQQLQEEISLNATDELGQTALIRATKEKDRIRVEQLLALGADANIRDKQGSNALDYAISAKMTQLLIPHTAEETGPSCIICMSNPHNMLDIMPCINKHDECYLCLDCYQELLRTNNHLPLCPMCRSPLKG